MRYRLRRGASVWDASGKREVTGFGRVLLLSGGAPNAAGLVAVRCAQTNRTGFARMQDLEVLDEQRQER